MSLALVGVDSPASPPAAPRDEGDVPPDAVASYAQHTRAFLGVPADIAVAFNSTAAAVVAALLKRHGVEPPDIELWHAAPDQPAEITLLSATCRPLARITFDVSGAATPEQIDAWLDRALGGCRLFNFGVEVFTTLHDDADMARGVAARLWDSLAGRRFLRL